MTLRSVAQHQPLPANDAGGGFFSYNLQGQLRFADAGLLDPFLVLTDFQMPRAFFPPHPHAGFSVMTYMFEDSVGAFINRDSFGDHSRIEAGALHWTQAGRGIQHEEIPEQEGQPCHGLQMWINHADRDRMAPPTRFHVANDQMPEVRPAEGVRVRVLVGEGFGMKAAFTPLTSINFFDVFLAPGATLIYSNTDKTALALFISGTARADEQHILAHDVVTFGTDGDTIRVEAGEAGCELLLGTGQPAGEPILYGGPFVATTADQLAEFKRRFGRGDMGTLTRSVIFN
jgi:quercetin 2,3-dioxygenase